MFFTEEDDPPKHPIDNMIDVLFNTPVNLFTNEELRPLYEAVMAVSQWWKDIGYIYEPEP